MRALILFALAAALGGCDLFSSCPPASFGAECDLIGEWTLVSIDGERTVGVMELSDVGDAYFAIDTGETGPYGPYDLWRGGARWSVGTQDDVSDTFTVRTWFAASDLEDPDACPDGVACARRATFDADGRFELDGDRVTLRLRDSAFGPAGPLAGTLVFER